MKFNFSNKKILIAGAAGFIGSNIINAIVSHKNRGLIALDNLETGNLQNIKEHIDSGAITFLNSDIRNIEDCLKATQDCDIVLHQAALGSVPRSIEHPLNTHSVNVTGFINILEACRQNKVERVVYASSSSVYGDDLNLPKREEVVGSPLSPYAVSKKTNELYANVFGKLYNMKIIGLRYFNVFGPNQNAAGPYAAVIPIFVNNILQSKDCLIYGDGSNRRDFTFVDNVVQANLLAAQTENTEAYGEVFNIAYGATKSINHLFEEIKTKMNVTADVKYMPPRVGEIKDSFADIGKAEKFLGYKPQVDLSEGINRTIDWYKSQY